MRKGEPHDKGLVGLIAGRTLNEQIELVRKQGNHGIVSTLRGEVLRALGISKPKQHAENFIMLGGYIPFSYPLLVRDYFKLLDLLEIEYSYLKDEFCCGAPMTRAGTGAERKGAIEAGKEFMRMNWDVAEHRGAKTMAYCCVGCAHMSKVFFPDELDRHMYVLDLIIDKLETSNLRVNPTVMGYYEGCHAAYLAIFPEADLAWGKYRQVLDRIQGLRIVDLPRDICCREHPERTVEIAVKQSLDTIICPCNACYDRIGTAGKGKVQVKSLAEVLLQGLEHE